MVTKPGGWLDALLFGLGAAASGSAVMGWDARRWAAPTAHAHLREAVSIIVLASAWSAGVYRAAQRKRVREDLLFPRPAGYRLSVVLGAFCGVLWLAGSWAIDRFLEGWVGPANLGLACLIPWLLARAQWTDEPPGSNRAEGDP